MGWAEKERRRVVGWKVPAVSTSLRLLQCLVRNLHYAMLSGRGLGQGSEGGSRARVFMCTRCLLLLIEMAESNVAFTLLVLGSFFDACGVA